MSDSDELLIGSKRESARDTDGDGVSDAQESLDGTDPNDANSSIRHDEISVDRNGIGNDPRGDLRAVTLEGQIVVDVNAGIPEGKSLEQSLGTGLDGKSIPTGPNHHGNSTADGFLEGRQGENSPLDMQRNPLQTGPAGSGVQGNSEIRGGHGDTPPPGEELSFRAPNMGLVSAEQPKPYVAPPAKPDPPAAPQKQELKPFDKPEETWGEWWARVTSSPKPGSGLDNLGEVGNKTKKYVDPDAGGGGAVGPMSVDDLERIVAVNKGDVDFVRGFGTPQIDESGPPKGRFDLVTDKNPDAEDTTVVHGDAVVPPPGQEVSKPVNPQDNLGPPRSPSGGAGGGGGSGDGDGSEGAQDGVVGISSAATAAEAPAPSGNTGIHTVAGDANNNDAGNDITGVGSGSGVVNIGTGNTGTANATDDTGRASESAAMMGGDDDDLEELEVQRNDRAVAGPGTQTEDEIYIGATSAPVDPSGSDSDGGSGGDATPPTTSATTSSTASTPTQLAPATVGEVILPVMEIQVVDGGMAAMPDPVAAALADRPVPLDEPASVFSRLDAADDDTPIDDHMERDDGL